MKKKNLISLVCVAVLSQYGLAPVTALANENENTVTGTMNSEDLKTNTILDDLPLNAAENAEEPAAESESTASETAEETAESTTETTEVEEAKTLNWEFKDPKQALTAGDDFTVKIKGTHSFAKIVLPEGIEYDLEKNTEELRPLISFDEEKRELQLTKIDEYEEIELVLTAEKAGDYELQMSDDAQEKIGDKLVFAVAEKAEETEESKEEEQKDADKKEETPREEQKKESETKTKIGPQAAQHSNVSLNVNSTPDDKITDSSKIINYIVDFSHSLSTDVLTDGKIVITLTNGVFVKVPTKSSNMKTLTMSYDKKTITIELNDDWNSGNVDSVSLSVKSAVGISKGDNISLNAEFTGKFKKETDSFSNVAKKDILFDTEGIKDVQPGTSDWAITGWKDTEVYAGTDTEILGYLRKDNESTKEGFSNLKIKIHISDVTKLNWFSKLFKQMAYHDIQNSLHAITLEDNQIQKIDDQTYIFTLGNISPEEVNNLLTFMNVNLPEDAQPGESVSVKAEYYNDDTQIFDVPVMTITVKEAETNFTFRYRRDTQGKELAPGQTFNTAVTIMGTTGKPIDDVVVETEVPDEVQPNKVVNGIMSSLPALKKVEYFDGVNWFEATSQGDDFLFPQDKTITKIRYYYIEVPYRPGAHQPFRTFYTVKSTSGAGDTFELPNSVTFTDAKGDARTIESTPNTLDYVVVADKKEQANKIATYKYLPKGDFGIVSSGDKYTRSYRLVSITGEIDQPYIFVKVPKGITVENKYNSIQYPYDNTYKSDYPRIGTPASPISKANNVGTFQTEDGDTVYYFKADDTKLSAADYIQMLLVENQYTIGYMMSGNYEVEVGMGSLTEDFTEPELNDFTAETLSTEMQTKLGASVSNYYSNKKVLTVGQGERVNTTVNVKGSEDADWKDATKNEVGTVTPGKKVSYKISMKNDGAERYSDVELVNILPHIGDALVSSPGSPRGSEFQINPDSGGIKVYLNGVETNDVTLQYSLSNDPVRFASPSGDPIGSGAWVSSVSDFSQVRAVRVSLPNARLNPGDELVLEYSGVVVLDAKRPANDTETFVAKNSVAYKFETEAGTLRVNEPAVSSVKTSIAQNDGLISGNVYIDLNRDGNKTGTEPGLNQVQFELFKKEGSDFVTTGLTSESSSDSSNNNGIFGFNDLKYGTYKVKVTLPSTKGAEFITIGTDKVEKIDATTAWVMKNGSTEFTINDATSHEIKDLSVPLYVSTPLNGTINFVNKDGNVVASDYGKDFTVELYKGTTRIAGTTAGDHGAYVFENLSIDSSDEYKIKATAPSGKSFVFTTANSTGEITIDMEPGIGTKDATDLYITDTDTPTASIAIDNGHGSGKDINPDSVTLTAADKTTSISTDWKITKGGTVEYSGTSAKGTISLEDQIGYLIGDKKAGDYTVEMTVTDFAGNKTTVTKNFSIKFATASYMVEATEYAKEENLLLYSGKLTKPKTDPTKAGYVFDKWVKDSDNTEWDFSTGTISEENLVLKATFKAAKQKVTFDINGGDASTQPDDIEKDTATTVDLSGVAAPTRKGYTFKHWYKQGDVGKADVGNSITMPAGGVTLVAEWEANSYKVTFDKNDGTGTMADQDFKYDTAQNLRTNGFARDGYSFQGWATSKTGAKKYDNNESVKNLSDKDKDTVTLYAVWKANEQTITFDVNGGDATSKPGDIKQDTATTVDLSGVAAPTRKGYTFKHWYKQSDASKADVGNSITMPAGGVTLVAEWEANSYKVTFDKNDGTGTMADQSFKYDTAQNLTANKFTRDGYTFQGWSTKKTGAYMYLDNASVNNLTAVKDETVTLYAIWKADSQIVQFDVNGGDISTKPGNISGDTDSTVDLSKVKAPARTGYTFKHWYKQGDASKADVGASITMPANGMTLVADWKANTYTVNFHKNTGTGTMTAQDFKYDETKKLTKNSFVKDGYTFIGWSTTSDGTSSFVDEASVSNLTADNNGSVDLYAVWSASAQVIQFDVNGGDTSSKPDNIDGSTDQIIDLSGVKIPTRTGYTFTHWYKQGDVAKADVGASVTMPAKGMTLVAEWEANDYKVVFNSNSGKGSMAEQDFKYDTAQNLTANTFTRDGYTFQGWSTKQLGTVAYSDGVSVTNLTTVKDEVVTLYAVWKADKQTIQFDVNGGDLTSKPADIEGDTDSTVDLSKVKAPKRTGYSFKHWYKQGDVSKADVGGSTTMPANGLTLVAEWEANSYTVNFHNNTGEGAMTPQVFKYDTAQKLTKNSFTKDGYTFAGWSTTADGTSSYVDEANVSNLTADKDGTFDLYAVWTAAEQVIQFDVNGGNASSKPDNISGDTASTIDLSKVKKPTRTGYTFKHWYKQGDAGKADVGDSITMPAGGLILVAEWEANSYKVTFDKNDGTGTMADQSFKYDTAQNLTANKFTRDGYTFQGWSTKKTGAYMYLDNASVNNLTAVKDETVTLYAIWKADSQIVQFDVNGGDISTKPGNISGDTDSTVDLSKVKEPTRTGYTFKHWYKQGDAAKADVGASITMPANGVTLVADWKANTYTVNFHKNTGTGTMTAQDFKYDETKKLTKNSFVKDGYTFVGWSTTSGGTSSYVDEATVSNLTADNNGSIDLYAVWSASAQIVQFDVNGGDVSSKPGNITGNTDDTIDLSSVKNPTRTGYTFKHWYKKGDTAKADVGKSVTMPAKGMTLVAEWEANNYTVKFNANGGTEAMADQAFVYDKAQALTENKFKRAGYNFAGWSTTANGAVNYADKANVTNLTGDKDGEVELFAVWNATEQTIAFDVNGGDAATKPADIKQKTDTDVDLAKVTAPTRKGYTFTHWYVQGDAAKAPMTSTFKMPAGGLVLVAEWQANDYTVAFDANGGTGAMSDQSFTYDAEQKLTANAFDRTNYDFVGWSTTKTGSVKYANEEAIKNLTDVKDGTETLYAVWKLQERVISFDVNGGDLATQPKDIQTGIGENVELDKVTAPTREGYTFDHWYDKEDAAKAAVSGTIPMPDKNMVLVAAWKANHYKVAFKANGGTGTMKDQAFVYDTPQELTANAFERKNYDFIGWSTEKDGVVAHYDKDSVDNLTAKDGDTVTLYAIWEKKAVLPVIKANNIVLTTEQVEEFMTANVLDKKIAELSDAKVIDENTDDVLASYENISVDISAVKGKKGVYKAALSYETKARSTVESREIDVTVIDPAQKIQTISFDVNGGDTKTQPADITAPVGTTVSLKDVKNPTRSGYTFSGWFNGETKVGETVEMPENGMKLVAHWSQDNGNSGTSAGTGGSKTSINGLSSTSTTSTSGKSLPKTNDTPTVGMTIVGGMLALLALFGFKKKKDEESESESK
ncbi:InlB B-repeat-containing protein [Candidatus Enterococcus murrayae]|uniref:InlB B-repeat-containing protein n=1 Tax=Candidatus Enterococcus murrayae TaxID=2815321 RepID=A0ABS3HJX7_9ENTE|nr:InlB B-repeat-containing protein [Enterococcus sp. MJM16]MBO0453195.1 InlB B-repeat-containing protein [Enterococcus sp. MJM16]